MYITPLCCRSLNIEQENREKEKEKSLNYKGPAGGENNDQTRKYWQLSRLSFHRLDTI